MPDTYTKASKTELGITSTVSEVVSLDELKFRLAVRQSEIDRNEAEKAEIQKLLDECAKLNIK